LLKIAIAGVILAGGDNKRFGGLLKSGIVIDGKTIISRIAGTITGIFDELIIVTNRPSEFREYSGFRIISDHFRKAGPLAGIHAALKATSCEAAFIFAGDMPFLDSNLIRMQISFFEEKRTDALIVKTGDLIEPLHAIYRVSLIPDLENYITCGKSRAVRDFIKELAVDFFEPQPGSFSKKAFTNINSRSDIEKLASDLYI